jgi:hypothetical protein
MNTHLKSSRRIASAFLLSVAFATCASAADAPPPQLLQQVEAARTGSDYDALATYYDKEAAMARAVAAEHRKMAKSYQGMTGGGRGGASMPAHCNAIASKSDGLAKEYDGMAAGYRQMAKQAKP